MKESFGRENEREDWDEIKCLLALIFWVETKASSFFKSLVNGAIVDDLSPFFLFLLLLG